MLRLLNNVQDLYLICVYYMKCMYLKCVWVSVKVLWILIESVQIVLRILKVCINVLNVYLIVIMIFSGRVDRKFCGEIEKVMSQVE